MCVSGFTEGGLSRRSTFIM